MKFVEKKTIQDINCLLRQLSKGAKKCSEKKVKRILQQPCFLAVRVVSDDVVVGMASILIFETLIKKIGIIEDVVVDKKHRGKSLGKKMVMMLVAEARKRKTKWIQLTCRPERKEANAMYKSLGFKKMASGKTNLYRLIL